MSVIVDTGVHSIGHVGDVCGSWPTLGEAFKSIACKRRSISRPTRETRVTKLLSQAAECYAFECDGGDEAAEYAARSLLVFLRSLDDAVTYWEEGRHCKEKAYGLIGIHEHCMEHLRQAVVDALELMDRKEYGVAFGCLSNTPLLFTDEEEDDATKDESDAGDVVSQRLDDSWSWAGSVCCWSDADCSDCETDCDMPDLIPVSPVARSDSRSLVHELALDCEDTECRHTMSLEAVGDVYPTATLPLVNGFVHFDIFASAKVQRSLTAPASCWVSDDIEGISTCDELSPRGQVDMEGPNEPEFLPVSKTFIHFTAGRTRRW